MEQVLREQIVVGFMYEIRRIIGKCVFQRRT